MLKEYLVECAQVLAKLPLLPEILRQKIFLSKKFEMFEARDMWGYSQTNTPTEILEIYKALLQLIFRRETFNFLGKLAHCAQDFITDW